MEIGSVLDVIPRGILSVVGGLVASQLGNLLRIDHPMTHEYAIEIDGFVTRGYVSAEGLSDRLTPYLINSVNEDAPIPIFPYQRKIGMVTLKKGLTYQGQMEDWYYSSANWQIGDKSPLKDVDFIQLQRMPKSIPLIGGQLIEVKRWKYPLCVCRDLTPPKYGATKDEISINETIIQTTRPKMVGKPTSFGALGLLLDAITK